MDFDLFEKFSGKRELQDEFSLSNDFDSHHTREKLTIRLPEKEKTVESEKPPMDTLSNIEMPFTVSPAPSSTRLAPWVGHCSTKSKWIRLHEEILSYVDYIRPTEAELHLRLLIVHEIRRLCTQIWPRCIVKTFGSMETHLILPKSDIDVCVLNVQENVDRAMKILASHIEKHSLSEYGSLRIIENAKVPIIKFLYRGTLYSVDICINSEDGLINTATLRELLDMYPMAYPLTMVVKMYLYLRRLHEPYHGGLGSYATCLLVISFLQNHPYRGMQYADRTKVSAGILLADFFRYMGFYFNFMNVGIDLIDGGECFRKDERDTRGLLVEDPASYDNNAASAARHFGSITKAFESAHLLLMTEDQSVLKKLQAVYYKDSSDDASRESRALSHSDWRLSRLVWITNDEHDYRRSLPTVLENLSHDRM